MTTRMELFDSCVAVVFARLYEHFPERIDFEFPGDMPISLVEESDSAVDVWVKFGVFEATVKWLHQAGYIWADRITSQGALQVVLSPKALEVLKVPQSLSKKKEPLGQFLTSAVKAGAKAAIQKGVSAALTEGFKLLAGTGQGVSQGVSTLAA